MLGKKYLDPEFIGGLFLCSTVSLNIPQKICKCKGANSRHAVSLMCAIANILPRLYPLCFRHAALIRVKQKKDQISNNRHMGSFCLCGFCSGINASIRVCVCVNKTDLKGYACFDVEIHPVSSFSELPGRTESTVISLGDFISHLTSAGRTHTTHKYLPFLYSGMLKFRSDL